MENVFGVARQSYGCNDHPSPEQFSIIINSLSFYSTLEVITLLLKPADVAKGKADRLMK